MSRHRCCWTARVCIAVVFMTRVCWETSQKIYQIKKSVFRKRLQKMPQNCYSWDQIQTTVVYVLKEHDPYGRIFFCNSFFWLFAMENLIQSLCLSLIRPGFFFTQRVKFSEQPVLKCRKSWTNSRTPLFMTKETDACVAMGSRRETSTISGQEFQRVNNIIH